MLRGSPGGSVVERLPSAQSRSPRPAVEPPSGPLLSGQPASPSPSASRAVLVHPLTLCQIKSLKSTGQYSFCNMNKYVTSVCDPKALFCQRAFVTGWLARCPWLTVCAVCAHQKCVPSASSPQLHRRHKFVQVLDLCQSVGEK